MYDKNRYIFTELERVIRWHRIGLPYHGRSDTFQRMIVATLFQRTSRFTLVVVDDGFAAPVTERENV